MLDIYTHLQYLWIFGAVQGFTASRIVEHGSLIIALGREIGYSTGQRGWWISSEPALSLALLCLGTIKVVRNRLRDADAVDDVSKLPM